MLDVKTVPTAPKGKRTASQKEMLFLQALEELTLKANPKKKDVAASEVVHKFNDYIAVSAVFMGVMRKKLITTRKNQDDNLEFYSLTKEGLAALNNPSNTVGDTAGPRSLEERYGPRPEDVGPKPTKLEVMEARLAKALTDYKFQQVDRRLHAYSDVAKNKETRAREKYEKVQTEYDALLAAGDGDKEAGAKDLVEEKEQVTNEQGDTESTESAD